MNNLAGEQSNNENSVKNITVIVEKNKENTNQSDPTDLCDKYRSILQNLLKLKNDLVTKSISQAIQSTITDLKTASSEDWLRVIFKTVGLILDTVNIKQIHLNVK